MRKHVPSLARRQPCRSHVARAVKSRAYSRVLAVIAALGLGVRFGFLGSRHPGSSAAGSGPTAVNEQSPLGVLNEGLRAGDHQMLALIHKRAMPVAECAPPGRERARRRRVDRRP